MPSGNLIWSSAIVSALLSFSNLNSTLFRSKQSHRRSNDPEAKRLRAGKLGILIRYQHSVSFKASLPFVPSCNLIRSSAIVSALLSLSNLNNILCRSKQPHRRSKDPEAKRLHAGKSGILIRY